MRRKSKIVLIMLTFILISSTSEGVTNYKPKGRDPFVSLIEVLKEKVKPKKRKITTPLQLFELDRLKLVGILHLGNKFLAMMETPDGKAYSVKVGMLIGKEDAKVVKITLDKVILEKSYIDFFGKTHKITTILELPLKRRF